MRATLETLNGQILTRPSDRASYIFPWSETREPLTGQFCSGQKSGSGLGRSWRLTGPNRSNFSAALAGPAPGAGFLPAGERGGLHRRLRRRGAGAARERQDSPKISCKFSIASRVRVFSWSRGLRRRGAGAARDGGGDECSGGSSSSGSSGGGSGCGPKRGWRQLQQWPRQL